MAVGRILINGVDVSRWVQFDTAQFEGSLGVKETSLSFEMIIKNYDLAEPKTGNVVYLEIYEDSDWDFDTQAPKAGVSPQSIEFGGTLGKIKKEEAVPPDKFRYSCEARDWTAWLDRRLITVEIPVGDTLLMAAWKVIKEVTEDQEAVDYYGPPVGIIPGYPTPPYFFYVTATDDVYRKFETMEALALPAYSFIRASDYFNKLCESTGFQWYVDSQRVIHFYGPDSYAHPNHPTIYETSVAESDPDRIAAFSDLVIEEDITAVRNSFWFADLTVPSGTREIIVTKEIVDAPWWVDLVMFFLKYPPCSWIPVFQEAVIYLKETFYMPRVVNVPELEEVIRLWVVDLDALTNPDGTSFEDIEESKIQEITNFEIVEKGYDLNHLKSQTATAFYCPETGDLIISSDLIDWSTQGIYMTGPGTGVQHVRLDEFPAIDELREREHSCGRYEEYISAVDFPLTWATGDIFERLSIKHAYPKKTGSMISRTAGWSPGMKFEFQGKTRWRMLETFYVVKVVKTFESDRIMKTELEFGNNLLI